jgi:tetratricopeptide (TPR) repeat protein
LLLAVMASNSHLAYPQSAVCDQAAAHFQARRWTDAAQAYAECEKFSSPDGEAHLFRAKALVNTGDFNVAAAELDAYIATKPQSDDALYLLGFVRFRQNQPRESLETFARASKIRPPQASDLKIAALDYVLLNDYTSAARYLEQSLAMDPADNEALYHVGRVRYQQNRFDLAIEAFESLLKRDPANLKAEDNLGLCLEATGKSSAAISAYRKAIEMDAQAEPHSEQPYLNLGKLLNTLNREAEALPVLTKAITINEGSPGAHYELGRAEFALDRFEEARGQLERAAELDPHNSAPHYLLGRILSRMGRQQEAAAEFKLTENLIREKDSKLEQGMASPR